jgi:IS4 transposase
MIKVLKPKNDRKIPMATIAQITEAINVVFGDKVDKLARESRFIRREVVVSGLGFVKSLVMAFQGNKAASYSELSACASSIGMPITSQGIEQRFCEKSAQFMKAVLEHALAVKVKGVDEQSVPLLQKFKAVHIRDSSVISLPQVLKDTWKGVGGSLGETSSLKVQVSWDQWSGSLDGITLQDGYCQDRTSPYQHMELNTGELHIGDLGYFSLEKLSADQQKGVLWLTRLKFKTLLWDEQEMALDLLTFLANQTQTHLDLSVHVGRNKQVFCRLLASQVPQEIADQRRQRILESYRKKGRQPSPKLLQLADWTLVLTNVPQAKLSIQEALVLLKIRWQIELLFKLWKSYLSIDQWTSQNHWRILTEIYAKLLIAILFHWTMLIDFWQYPDRSMFKAYKTFQYYALPILLATNDHQMMAKTLSQLSACYAKSCRISKHPNSACTFQALLSPSTVLC